jgi:tRNA dimethylallyltransferase
MSDRGEAIFLMGPTGAGKTDLAVEIAKRLPCGVISVDSAMVYRGMDIGTNKPPETVLAHTPHRLIDIRDPAESYSAAEFRTDALEVMRHITGAGRIPLLVGGTGLYFRVLEEGISELPRADPAARARITVMAAENGWPAVHQRLSEVDPFAASRIHPNDSQRIQRALEIHEATGQSMSVLCGLTAKVPLPYKIIKIILAPTDRIRLHEQLRLRFLSMLEHGLIEEVEQLYQRGDLNAAKPSIRMVGYRQVWHYLTGGGEYHSMVEDSITATRRLAKRQVTWLRAEHNADWFDCDDPRLLEKVLNLLYRKLSPFNGVREPTFGVV